MDNNEKVLKKRGRKPKIKDSENWVTNEEVNVVTEKKKRGRKKKYENENNQRLLNREFTNNFDHKIIYSSDEEKEFKNEEDSAKEVKNVSFGNLNIVISKNDSSIKNKIDYVHNLKKNFKPGSEKVRVISNSTIDINEYSSEDEESEIIQKVVTKKESFVDKKIKVVSTIKDSLNVENEWPETTDIFCWWCCHQFDTVPCTLPIKYDPLRKRFEFTGIFCSWNCVKAYNLNINDQKKYERSQLITLLVKKLYSLDYSVSIKPSPPRQCLKMFGGYMDISDFRESNYLNSTYVLNLLSKRFIYPEITEIYNNGINKSSAILSKKYKLSRNKES